MNKKTIFIGVATCIVVMIVLLVFFSPRQTIEVYRDYSFMVDRAFPDVRRAFYRQDFVREVLEVHDAELVEKKWLRHDLDIRRPIFKESEYTGVMLIIARSKEGYGTIHIEQTVTLKRDRILALAKLDRPMSAGVTDWNQDISIIPEGEKTKISIKLYARLSRPIPRIFWKYAEEQMNVAADKATYGMEPLLTEMATKDVGLLDFTVPMP